MLQFLPFFLPFLLPSFLPSFLALLTFSEVWQVLRTPNRILISKKNYNEPCPFPAKRELSGGQKMAAIIDKDYWNLSRPSLGGILAFAALRPAVSGRMCFTTIIFSGSG